MSLSWAGVVSVVMRWALGRPSLALVEQDGLADPGEFATDTVQEVTGPPGWRGHRGGGATGVAGQAGGPPSQVAGWTPSS